MLRRVLLATVISAIATAPVAAQTTVELFDIQGSGLRSPLEGERVTTRDNTVTAVASGGFFLQASDDRADGNPLTSDGVWVDTAGTPQVEVGDRVDVTGRVLEVYGLTTVGSNPEVTITSSDSSLPTVVDLDQSTPTPDQPVPSTEFERYEGMRVRVAEGVVTGASNVWGDCTVVATRQRLFREPGIEYPGLPDLPVFDGNPEAFELDPDAVGLDDFSVAAGTPFSAVGVLSYAFGDFQLWPTELSLGAAPQLPRPVRPRAPDELSVASQNLYLLFDDGHDGHGEIVLSTEEYVLRLDKLARQVREVLGAPDVVAVQEAESLRVLQDLADTVAVDDPATVYTPHLLQGNQIGSINIGFLVRDTATVAGLSQIGADVRFDYDGTLLFDRPPLVLEITQPMAVTVVNVHLRSLGGIEDPDTGPRVRRKRHDQALWLSQWLQQRQAADPEEELLVVGDLNAFEFSDGYADVIGQLTGRPDPAGALLPATPVVAPAFANVVLSLPTRQRYSFVYQGSAEVLDHALVSTALLPRVRSMAYSRGNADAPVVHELATATALRSSDHDGLVVYLGEPMPTVRRGARRP